MFVSVVSRLTKKRKLYSAKHSTFPVGRTTLHGITVCLHKVSLVESGIIKDDSVLVNMRGSLHDPSLLLDPENKRLLLFMEVFTLPSLPVRGYKLRSFKQTSSFSTRDIFSMIIITVVKLLVFLKLPLHPRIPHSTKMRCATAGLNKISTLRDYIGV